MIKRLLLIVAILFAQFWIFEAGLRWHAGLEAAPGFQSLFMPDPIAGYRMRPGASTRFTRGANRRRILTGRPGRIARSDCRP